MKRVFAFLLTVFILTSCSLDDDGPDYHDEFMPISSVEISETMVVNTVNEIILTYERPNSCYIYNNIYYSYDDETIRTVAIICSVYEGSSYGCETLDYPDYDVSFDFKPTQIGTYTFKFWQGDDDNGEGQYLIIDVEVTQ